MTVRGFGLVALALAAVAGRAHAGGIVLPGNGAVSSARAGAWVVGVEGADAVAINPAGLTRRAGTHVSVSAVFANYDLTFSRRGTYDPVDDATLPWEGQPFPPVSDTSTPREGIAGYQAVPTIVVAGDLSRWIDGLHLGVGFHAPTVYPARRLGADYVLDDPDAPPPPTRYDTLSQDALLVQTSVALGYRVSDRVSVGARFSWAMAELSATTYLWGQRNYEEWTGADTVLEIEAADRFVPSVGAGVLVRATPAIELGVQLTGPLVVEASGTARATPSASLSVGGAPVVVSAVDDAAARCARGGTAESLRACVDFSLPMMVVGGARYVFRDRGGRERADVELDVGWENWSAERATNYRVVVDGQVNDAIRIKEQFIRHGLKDTFSVRVGGSYHLPVGGGRVIARAGVGHDTAAAKPGWERVDLDGAARTTLGAGASYRTGRYQFDLGVGAALSGTREVPGTCNPDVTNVGCSGAGTNSPIADRRGPDPINAVVETENQDQSPVNQGTFESGYTLFMLGVSAWF